MNEVSTENNKKNSIMPFLLKPAEKDYLWGGRRLKDDFCKETDTTPLAETWECSTHPDGLSTVASGEYKGMALSEVLKMHPEYLGTHPRENGYDDLPILVKLIDADSDLSVQVHPTDEYAMEYENGQRGKTEMWYVIDAAPDTSLIYGFRHSMTVDKLKKAIDEGKLTKYLQKVKVHKDDVFFIEAGTVHAIGNGAVIAEVQENSNLTYRLYDYDRVDKNGNKRELHIDKALNVMNMSGAPEPKQPMRVLKFRPGYATELLGRCKYFQMERMMLNTERIKQMAGIKTEANSFAVLLCVDGCGIITDGGDGKEVLPFFKGDCIFIPADSDEMLLHGNSTLLKISC